MCVLWFWDKISCLMAGSLGTYILLLYLRTWFLLTRYTGAFLRAWVRVGWLELALLSCAKASLCWSWSRTSNNVSDPAGAGSLLTSTLASERGTHGVHPMALAVETFTALHILATCVLHAPTELGLGVDLLALLCSSLARSLFCKVGNN
jgi:hypothetical protein